MRRIVIAVLGLGMLSACTPADEQYCRAYGVGGTQEFGKCLDYYHRQEQIFGSDHAACAMQADQTYPRSLYDHGGYVPVMTGYGPWPHGDYAFVEPDYRRNAEVDGLRMRIVGPCMQAKGWNSAKTWQAGRHNATRAAKIGFTAKSIPSVTEVDAPDAPPSSLNSLPWLQ